ncbi:MAG: GNAT family N-acetyltransferase [Anaerolineae bacterium]|nr:GNAT family N-acetyltransferase [Anaerolineae bacterium]
MTDPRHLTVRIARRADAPAIHEVHTASTTRLWASHYAPNLIEQWIKNRTPEGYYPGIDRREMYVCEINGQVIGFGHAVPGEIAAIFVHPAHIRQGIGTLLLLYGLALARRDHPGPIRLQATLNAQAFYEHFGFKATKHTSVPGHGIKLPVVEMELRSGT